MTTGSDLFVSQCFIHLEHLCFHFISIAVKMETAVWSAHLEQSSPREYKCTFCWFYAAADTYQFD